MHKSMKLNLVTPEKSYDFPYVIRKVHQFFLCNKKRKLSWKESKREKQIKHGGNFKCSIMEKKMIAFLRFFLCSTAFFVYIIVYHIIINKFK